MPKNENLKGPVLVVDDDFEIRESVADILRDEGYFVVTTENGAAALERLRHGLGPALVLLDLMMPVMDGFEFCRAWKGDPTLSSIPVVVISADGSTAQKATSCGAMGYLMKPIQLDDLLAMVERHVG